MQAGALTTGAPCCSKGAPRQAVFARCRPLRARVSMPFAVHSRAHVRHTQQVVRCSSEAMSSAASSTAAGGAGSSTRSFEYTSHEGNSWEATFKTSGVRMLVDPWLVGNLVFADADWLYKGVKRDFKAGKEVAEAIGKQADFMLLTMSLPDHCHKPTLEALRKDLPVVASSSAAAFARSMGFTNVHELDHGQSVTVADGKVEVQATAGALVGPPWSKRENGFVVRETAPGGLSMYYEPHCSFDESSVSKVGTVDVVVSPPTSQVLAGVYPLVLGSTDNTRLLSLLRPAAMVALFNAEFDATGPLDKIIVEQGGVDQLQAQLKAAGLDTKIVWPAKAGVPLTVSV